MQTPPERFLLALHDTTTTQLLKSRLQLKMPLMRVHWCPFALITTYPVLRVSPLCPCWCSKVDECIAHITPAAEVNRKIHEVVQALAQHCFCGILGTCWKFAGNMCLRTIQRSIAAAAAPYTMPHTLCQAD